MQHDPVAFALRIARYQRVSAALWLVLGLVQLALAFKVFLYVGAIAGVWNIWAAVTRWRLARAIRDRDPGVPAAFKPIWPLIAIGVVNVLVGGVVGVAFVGIDLYVRKQVLDNASVFERAAA